MKLKKKFGQHLLNNPSFYNNVLNHLEIERTDNVLEIGPGSGYFTKEILNYVNNLTVFEVDKDFCYLLKNFFNKKITLVQSDILKVDLNKFLDTNKRNIILGNLPYYITTPIIKMLIEYKKFLYSAGIMVQKEFADKLSAQPGTKARTSMSIIFQCNFEIQKVFNINKNAFIPPPKVDSTFLIIRPLTLNNFSNYNEYLKFSFYVQELFNHKRKKFSNVIKNLVKNNDLIMKLSAKYDLNKRAEDYSLDELISIIKTIINNT